MTQEDYATLTELLENNGLEDVLKSIILVGDERFEYKSKGHQDPSDWDIQMKQEEKWNIIEGLFNKVIENDPHIF